MNISSTTRELTGMLKASIITLLRAEKDMSVDVSNVRIFPDDGRAKEESDDSEEEELDIFA